MTTSPVWPTPREVVAAEIRSMLRRYRVKNVDLEKLFGKSQSALSRKINGESRWEPEEIRKLADYLHITVDQLLNDALTDLEEVQHLAVIFNEPPEAIRAKLRTSAQEYALAVRPADADVTQVRPADNRPIGRSWEAGAGSTSPHRVRPVRVDLPLAG
jgi:hypothetical protein